MAPRSSGRALHSTTVGFADRLRAAATGRSPDLTFHGWRGIGSQALLLTPPALLYFLVRDLSAGQRDTAFANAASIVDLQKAMGLDWEATLQQEVLHLRWVIDAVNWIYIYGHFPLILAAMVGLFRLSRDNYVTLRNALIASGTIGLVCFAFYPVAPPRLFEPDVFFDSLGELSASYHILQNPKVTNQFAALPSFHVGWNLIVSIALWRAIRFRALKLVAAALPILMSISVVLTANHWLIDIVAGAGVALFGVAAAALFDRTIAPRLLAGIDTRVAECEVVFAEAAEHSVASHHACLTRVGQPGE